MFIKNVTMRGTVIQVDDVEIHVLDIGNKTVKLGIEAPKDKKIHTDTYLRRDVGTGQLPNTYRRES